MLCKIAIIDSAICRNTVLIDNRRISHYYICNGKIVKKKDNAIFLSHGTEVLNTMLYECSDVEIISIEILDANNKGKAIHLLKAIEFCICNDVKFINISLGIVTKNIDFISALKNVCTRAVENGITIVSAMDNKKIESYPAAFDSVVAVSSDIDNKEYITFKKKKNEICFCSASLISKGSNQYVINMGTSYLSGYVTGVLCSLVTNNIENKEEVLNFFNDNNIKNNIYIKPFCENELGKEIILISFVQNIFDNDLESQLGENVKKIQWSIIKEKRNLSVDTIIFGGLKLPCDKKIKREILQWIIYININEVYCLVPIFNTIERYEIFKRHKINIKAIYI